MPTDIQIPYNWAPRAYQMGAWNFFVNGGKRAALVWHRRAGKDLFALNVALWLMVQRGGLYWHVFPTYNQGRKAIWEGYTGEGRRFLDHFPEGIIDSVNNTDMRIKTKFGSTYQVVGADDVNRLVGTNPVGVILSEYSLQSPDAWELAISPILAENQGWAMFIYTPRGRNHGYTLFRRAKDNPNWYSELLKAGDEGTKRDDGRPVVSNEAIEEERRMGMSEALVRQEYYCSFEAPAQGAFYEREMTEAAMQERIGRFPPDQRLPVYTAWDLGLDNATAIWFFQILRNERRFINYMEDRNVGLPAWVRRLKTYSIERNLVYEGHYAPHDIRNREWASGGQTRIAIAARLGLKLRPVPRHDLADGIEETRLALGESFFDEDACADGLEALRRYGGVMQTGRGRAEYVPTKTGGNDGTDGADAYRTGAMGVRYADPGRRKRERPTRALGGVRL